MPKKNKRGREREKRKIKLRVCVKLPPFNHFQSKIKYKFVLYEENTGHMHQIAPLTTSKCKKLSLWEGGHPPPPPRSLRSLARYFFYRPPKIKSWLRHCLCESAGSGGIAVLSGTLSSFRSSLKGTWSC